MNLTESQLFTIEALNRIEGFVWPDGAMTGIVDGDRFVRFYDPSLTDVTISKIDAINNRNTFSTITKAEFDSVDRWVRVGGIMPHGDTPVDVKHYLDGKGFQSGSMAKFIKWDDVKLWRYHRLQKEKGMTLLEILVRELPKRGGWPSWAINAIQDKNKRIGFGFTGCVPVCKGGMWKSEVEVEPPKSNPSVIELYDSAFVAELLATDYATKIVTRAEYEAAVKDKLIELIRESLSNRQGNESISNRIAIDIAKFFGDECKPVDSSAREDGMDEQQSIEQIYDEYRKACIKLDEAKESVAWSTAQRDEALAKIKSWHKERGFDVSEAKLKFEPVVNVDVRLTDPSGKSVPWINHNEPNIASKEVRDKAPFGSTHYDGEHGGCYLQRIGGSWMMYVKGDWIRCDHDEQVLSRLMII